MVWSGAVALNESREPVLARFRIDHMAGVALDTPAGGVLGEAFGWRIVFVALGVLYWLLADGDRRRRVASAEATSEDRRPTS